ncbi:hypothetical protein EI74_0701 [Mycoplasma testudineum]|uniref:DhaL domain-containing protein n=1 Tax=Mycoplasma testudineum TaxID=244584 RepID=A0A4R6IB57_9MOLU|nr:DAK2 domain-containing protein [Mycoplasma testudineum]OYD26598.1 dihydroxyacetone kinase [Mycoplasma testudineum]TDO19430.1 hypothetical protein EI74_0701 [Mycoplasma testudineum]
MEKITVLDAQTYTRMYVSGAKNLENFKDEINRLNVFPVPDGDTGSNMSSSVNDPALFISQNNYSTISELSNAIAKQMLLSARGNSGVILSQIFRGLSVGMENKTTVTVDDFILALKSASEYAYKAVLEPVEGTILTVIREVSEKLQTKKGAIANFQDLFTKLVVYSKSSVDKTPEKLKVLREVGVVDSGGRGLYEIFSGMQKYLHGEEVRLNIDKNELTGEISGFHTDDKNVEFGYCTEFILKIKKPNSFRKDKFVDKFSKFAESLVVIQDTDILKVHGHSMRPGKFLDLVHSAGDLIKIKIDNMTLQSRQSQNTAEMSIPSVDKTKSAILTSNLGPGFAAKMLEFGAAGVIGNKEAHNPSAKQIIEAIKKINSEVVFVLPNNSNVILAAEQAAQTIKDKIVKVIPTKSEIAGIVAIQHFSPHNNLEENVELIEDGLSDLETAAIAKSDRETKINGVRIKPGEYLTIINGKIINTKHKSLDAAKYALKDIIDNDKEIVYIYYGAGRTEEEAQEVADWIISRYDDIEIEIVNGGQPIYDYIFGVK